MYGANRNYFFGVYNKNHCPSVLLLYFHFDRQIRAIGMSVVFNLPYLFKYICLLFLSDCIKSEECDSTLIYIDVNTNSNERVLARAACDYLIPLTILQMNCLQIPYQMC